MSLQYPKLVLSASYLILYLYKYRVFISDFKENKEKFHELAAFLLERETITGEEFMRLLNSEANVIKTSATVVKEGEADAEEASSI